MCWRVVLGDGGIQRTLLYSEARKCCCKKTSEAYWPQKEGRLAHGCDRRRLIKIDLQHEIVSELKVKKT